MIPVFNVLANPEMWKSVRYKYLASTSKGRLPPVSDQECIDSESSAPYLSMEYLRSDAEATTFVDINGLVVAKDKDVLLLWDGSNAGEFLRAKYGVVSSTAVLVQAKAIDRDYLFWISKAVEPVLRMFTNGMGIPHVDSDFLQNLRLLKPDLSIQRRISSYLDRETARIDSLVSEKEQMLALMEEKRAALISQAITRGLAPNVSLKPSGIDWLGSTPAHWDVMPIKYVAFVGNGSTPAVDNVDFWDNTGFPWLNSSVVNADYVREPSRRVTAKALKDCHLPIVSPPAVLIGITGQGKTRGMASVLMIEATINQHLAFIKPRNTRISAEYLRYVLLRAYSYLRSDSEGSGSTKGAITCEQLASFRIPLPPEEEQFHIVRQIQESERIMASIQNELKSSVRLLQERRTALITAAVTGQLTLEEMDA